MWNCWVERISPALDGANTGLCIISGSMLGLCLGDEFDLNEGALGQVLDGEGAASGVGCGEELGIDLVHGTEVGDLAQEDGSLNDVAQVEALALEDGAGIEQALIGLFLDASLRESAGGGVDGQLARDENEVASADGLAVRSNGSRCLIGV